MGNKKATVRSRELGDGLREQLRAAGLTGKQAAEQLGWSPSWVSRLLSGSRGATELDVATFLAVCGANGPERDRLLSLVRDQHTPSWFQPHGPLLPRQLRTLIDHENRAVTISQFEALVVPGLLQTARYARTVIRGGVNMPEEEVEDRVAARLARQSLLTRERPRAFTFYVHEPVLRAPVGGPAVMAEQLRHLERLAGSPKLTLRVVPGALGTHPGMAGSFELMEFDDIRPIAYLESQTASLFLEREEETRAYRDILAALDGCALDTAGSVALLVTLATEFETREVHDGDG